MLWEYNSMTYCPYLLTTHCLPRTFPKSPGIMTSHDTQVESRLWFSDGNIVLVAAPIAFKVHQGLLRRHSEVFDDILSLPQSPKKDPFDGCPWIELYDDPSDLFHFLTVIYDGIYFQTPRPEDFPVLSSVLRLSIKYAADSLRDRCLDRLKLDWPSNLLDWNERERKAISEEDAYVPRNLYPHPILVMELYTKLAQDCLDDKMISSAFYDLSRYGPSNIFYGVRASPKVYGKDDAKFTQLSCEVVQRVLHGRECGQRYIAGFIDRELRERRESQQCEYRAIAPANGRRYCREAFHYVHFQLLRGVGGVTHGRDADPLYTLSQAAEIVERQEFHCGEHHYRLRICGECKKEFVAAVKKSKEDLWVLTPSWFGFKSDKPQ